MQPYELLQVILAAEEAPAAPSVPEVAQTVPEAVGTNWGLIIFIAVAVIGFGLWITVEVFRSKWKAEEKEAAEKKKEEEEEIDVGMDE